MCRSCHLQPKLFIVVHLIATSQDQIYLVIRLKNQVRHSDVSLLLFTAESFSRLVKLVHTFLWCPNVVTAACTTCHLCGAGSTPAWGSAKTNEEVLELLLTWSDYPRKFLVVKAGGETCRLCFVRRNTTSGYT